MLEGAHFYSLTSLMAVRPKEQTEHIGHANDKPVTVWRPILTMTRQSKTFCFCVLLFGSFSRCLLLPPPITCSR